MYPQSFAIFYDLVITIFQNSYSLIIGIPKSLAF